MTRIESIFRSVPRTGVIYVMNEAGKRGFHYGHEAWANLGQGAPETGELPGCIPRIDEVGLDEGTHEYGPVPGLMEMREAVAALYNHRYRRGLPSQYTAENVAIAPGGRAALTRLAASLGEVNLGHVLPDYTAYEELLEVFRRFVPIPVPLDEDNGFRLTAEHLREAVVGTGLGALLISNPGNPTGQLIEGEALNGWTKVARDCGCALIIDEFYSHYAYERGDDLGHAVSAAAYVEDVDRDPVVLVDGLTKNWRYPGWRLSWTVGPKEVIERVSSAGSFLDGGASHALQRAALPLLEPEAARREATAIQTHFGVKRRRIIDGLEALGIGIQVPPKGAFYCFGSLHSLPEAIQDGMDFFRAALEEKVICVPGVFFDVNPGKRRSHIPSRLRSFVRFSFGPDEASIDRGLAGLGRAIAKYR